MAVSLANMPNEIIFQNPSDKLLLEWLSHHTKSNSNWRTAKMGNQKSKSLFRGQNTKICASIPDVLLEQAIFEAEYARPVEVQVAHYTPSSFPLVPKVTNESMALCKETWDFITQPVEAPDGQVVSGVTLFYTEFYDTLEVFDRTGKFETILRQHSGGSDTLAARGAILIRIIRYALALDPEDEKSQYMLFTLGKAHNQKRIRPWQYSIFVQVLLNTVSARLGSKATPEVMSAWVHLFAMILRCMLPLAIQGLVNETESDVNVATNLGDSKITDEIMREDEVREMKKILEKGERRRSRSSSATASQLASRDASRMASPRLSNAGVEKTYF